MKNKDSQTKDELLCLEKVKNFISKEYVSYIGLNQAEINLISNKIFNAVSNNESETVFPDFIIDDGFIEHFKITTSLDTKKGAESLSQIGSLKNQHTKKVLNSYKSESYNSDVIEDSASVKESSYSNLNLSIEKHVKKHLDSLKKSSNCDDLTTKIFMLELIEPHNLCTMLTNQKTYDTELIDENYLLLYDKSMQKKLYTLLHNKIDFIFLISDTIVEILNINNKNKIFEMDYNFAPSFIPHSIYHHRLVSIPITIPINITE